jgi:hypothetical protein
VTTACTSPINFPVPSTLASSDTQVPQLAPLREPSSIAMAALTDEHYRKLSEHDTYSDFEIQCQGRTWKVHKAIISGASDFFDLVCGGDFQGMLSS